MTESCELLVDLGGPVSKALYERSSRVIPGGVNSPVRAFKGVDSQPIFIERGEGALLYDADGRSYIDYVASWGPAITGHACPLVQSAISDQLKKGSSFGAPTELECEFAELLTEVFPSIDMIRMVNSGTEATMSAIRLARAFTGRDYIIKFNGCYHGHADSLLVKAGSGVATFGIAGSPGIPQAVAALSLSVEFNHFEQLEQAIKTLGPARVAAIIIEPVPGNMGLLLPQAGYLAAIRGICDQYGIVLIFDEVMSGFRVALGGAQERFGVRPDLTTLGKVIGGGLPVGAFGGRLDIMEKLSPLGPVYQAGTLSGNPLAMAAGLAVVRYLKDDKDLYPRLEALSERWLRGIRQAAKETGIDLVASSCGSMIGFFFSEQVVHDYLGAKMSREDRFKRFFHLMIQEGIYLAPSAFEAGFIGSKHTEALIDQTIDAAKRCFAALS